MRLLRQLASLFLRGPGAPYVLGDLEEAFRRDIVRGVPASRARLRYLGNLLRSAGALRADALRRRMARLPGTGVSLLDLKLGVRMLVKHPGLTAIGGFAIAFAIAVGAASFEFLKDAAYPILPVEEGDRVVRIFQVSRVDAGDLLSVTYEDFVHFRG